MSDWTVAIPFAILMIFCSLFVLCGALSFALGWKTLRLRSGQAGWIRVSAEIISATVEPRTLDESLMFLPKVTYRFSSGGGTFTSSKLRLIDRMYAKEQAARRKLEPYQPGTTVMAIFPLDQPQEAVLEQGGALAGLVFLLLGLGMVAAPLAIAAQAGYQVEPIILVIVVLFCLVWLGNTKSDRRRQRARRSGLLPPPGCGTDADIEKLLAHGEKQLAIRLYRELHGTDLKTAKEAVEKLVCQKIHCDGIPPQASNSQ